MRKFKYNGVEIEVPEKAPAFTHSVPMMLASFGRIEDNQNIPYFEKLVQFKETDLPEGELLHDACALNSIRHLNYQINNGGFEQYFDNGYHQYRAGYEIGDLTLLAIDEQIKFLKVLIDFILLADCNAKYKDELLKALTLFERQRINIIEYENYEPDNEGDYAALDGCNAFDRQWYKVNELIEMGIELYAQYLCKRLEAACNGSANK